MRAAPHTVMSEVGVAQSVAPARAVEHQRRSTPSRRSSARSTSPCTSAPTLVTRRTGACSRAAATLALAALPPPQVSERSATLLVSATGGAATQTVASRHTRPTLTTTPPPPAGASVGGGGAGVAVAAGVFSAPPSVSEKTSHAAPIAAQSPDSALCSTAHRPRVAGSVEASIAAARPSYSSGVRARPPPSTIALGL